ncbi:MAG: sporulation protein YabP [Clostridia bacterium]|nr:sporulation protein YabP [Clostridia bacterium]
MPSEDKARRAGAELPNNLILESRARLSVTGVVDVENFDETVVSMETSEGMLTVRGSGLHVEKLNLENGELALAGEIASLEYEERTNARGGLLAKLFG